MHAHCRTNLRVVLYYLGIVCYASAILCWQYTNSVLKSALLHHKEKGWLDFISVYFVDLTFWIFLFFSDEGDEASFDEIIGQCRVIYDFDGQGQDELNIRESKYA